MSNRRRKNGKSVYLGSWQEIVSEKIDLPFTLENLKKLLAFGFDERSTFTHQQIADWCYRFWRERNEGALACTADDQLDFAAQIAFDVDTQWDLFLANTYSLKELQTMDFSKVRLPEEWFRDWANHLTAQQMP